MSEPTLDQWKELYDLAAQFKALTPWKWIADESLFAVQDPADGELSYATILGGLGEAFGLILFVGQEGLQGYWRLVEGDVDPDSAEARVMLRALSLTFEDRRFLDKRDHQVIKSLGLKFRGRNAWPVFRSQQPGYVPWYLERDEASLLALSLRFAIEVTEDIRRGALRLNELWDMEDEVYTLLTREGEPRRQWVPMPEPPDPGPLPQPGAQRLQRLRNALDKPGGSIEADTFLVLQAVIAYEKGERPYVPRCLLVVGEDGMVLGADLLEPWASEAEQQEVFIDVLERFGVVPETAYVPSTSAFRLVQPVMESLGRRAELGGTPALYFARHSLEATLAP